MRLLAKFFPAAITSLCFAALAFAQVPRLAKPHARISANFDESVRTTLRGNIHPVAAAADQSEPADSGTPMEHMILFLKGDATQEAQLAQLISQQNDPSSSLYHQYLTPKDFASQFGVAQADIDKVTQWLESHGFTITEVPAGNRAVVFSGTAAQVAEAFQTEIRRYNVKGAIRYANATNPQIPTALADTVGGIVKLHNFPHGHSITAAKQISNAELAAPQFTSSGGGHYLAPGDYSTIYDIGPLYTAGINGTGQTIAVLARSNISMTDVQSFRTNFGLKANNPQIVITNSDPGIVQGDTTETTLDTEWSGAIAPNAAIKVIVSASTATADGVDLSALYAVNNNVAPIITLSYGSCEASMGSSELAFYNSLWKQAAAQGQSVFVSAGDSGAAGCDNGVSVASHGQGINGLCSSQYSTCVGGTQFVDTTNPGQYWLSGNNPTYGSAISYVPETVWNESSLDGGSGIWAGGGGVSIIYAKPSWQAGPGVPADGKRDVPDVSLTAAGHDGYLIWYSGALYSVGGTSAAAPSFAGMIALAAQKANARQGNVNQILYPLASKQASGGAAIFHDIKTGNNSVPGVTGFSATTGYDLASGLGSVDANLLVTHWGDATASAATLALASSSASLTVKAGQSASATITSTASNLNAAVALTVAGAPAGVTATFSPASIASPGSGSAVLNIVAASNAVPGTYTLTVTGKGGTQTASAAITLTIPTPTFTLAFSATSVNAVLGGTSQLSASISPANGFASTVTFAASGLPSGVTLAFSPTSISGVTGGSTIATLTTTTAAKSGSYPVTITATGGSVTQTSSFTLVVPVAASCTLAAAPASVTLINGQSASVAVSCSAVQGTFAAPLTLSVAGAPTGVTTKLSVSSVAAGSSATLTIGSSTTTVAGSYSLSVTAASGTFSKTVTIPLTIPTPDFSLTAAPSSLSVLAGASGQVSTAVSALNGFNSALAFSVTGLPTGVTAAFSSASVTTASTGSNVLTLTVAKTTKAGTYPLTITAAGGGVTHSVAVSLTVAVLPVCSLAANPASASLVAGQSTSLALSCSVTQGAFTSPLAFSVSGAPTGVTAQIASSAATTATLSLSSVLTTPAGTYSLSVTAAANGYTQTIAVPLSVTVPSVFTLASSAPTLTVKAGAPAQLSTSTLRFGAFNSAISFSLSGLPSGVSAAFSNAVIPAPGAGASTITFTASSTAPAGTYNMVVNAAGGGQTQSVPLTLIVAAAQNFSFTANTTAITVREGSSAPVIVSTGNYTGGFNSTIALTVSGLPAGGNWANAGATTANNLVNITYSFIAAASTPIGTYPVTITASGAGITHSVVVQMTVTK